MVTAEKEVFKKAFNKEAFAINEGEGGDGGLPCSPQKSKTLGLHPPKQWHLMINTTKKWDNASSDGPFQHLRWDPLDPGSPHFLKAPQATAQSPASI